MREPRLHRQSRHDALRVNATVLDLHTRNCAPRDCDERRSTPCVAPKSPMSLTTMSPSFWWGPAQGGWESQRGMFENGRGVGSHSGTTFVTCCSIYVVISQRVASKGEG